MSVLGEGNTGEQKHFSIPDGLVAWYQNLRWHPRPLISPDVQGKRNNNNSERKHIAIILK